MQVVEKRVNARHVKNTRRDTHRLELINLSLGLSKPRVDVYSRWLSIDSTNFRSASHRNCACRRNPIHTAVQDTLSTLTSRSIVSHAGEGIIATRYTMSPRRTTCNGISLPIPIFDSIDTNNNICLIEIVETERERECKREGVIIWKKMKKRKVTRVVWKVTWPRSVDRCFETGRNI